MDTVFFEIIVNAAEAAVIGIESRDEIEEPLEEMLSTTGFGEVTGGGGGTGVYIIDVELIEDELPEALSAVKTVLRDMKLPISTKLKKGNPDRKEFLIYEES